MNDNFKEQKPPELAILQDGTVIRLVPIERTGKALYASKDGEVYSYYRSRFRKLKPTLTALPGSKYTHNKKHQYLKLWGMYNNILVHHAVKEAWEGPRPAGMICDHINGNTMDNRLCNLEWVTPEENMRRRWVLYAKQGKGYSGKKLTELGKHALLVRRKYAKKHGILIQLEIAFPEEDDETIEGISLVDKIIEIDGEAVSPNK